MAITESDIKLLASERLNDDADGGGFMTGNVVADGAENNLFPDVADADRTFGRVQLRKVYAAVTSADADTYIGAHVILDDYPDDPAVSALMVTKAGYAQVRSDIVSALDASSYKVAADATKRILGGAVLTADVTTHIQARYTPPSGYSIWNGVTYFTGARLGEVVPGDVLGLFTVNAASPIPAVTAMEVVYVGAVAGAYGGAPGDLAAITLTQPVRRSYNANVDVVYNPDLTVGYSSAPDPNDYAVKLTQDTANGALLFYGQTATTADLSPGDTTIPVVSSFAQYIPVGDGGSYPTVPASILGVNPAPFAATGGRVKIFRPAEACVIHHTQTEAPQAVTAGQTIDLGRERLAKVKLIGADGAPITTGYTADLVAGHVTINSVAGYSQPVTISHRIEDMLLVDVAGERELTVARGVTHDYPAGSRVSSVLFFGDLQARVHPGFDQGAWTGVWSDEPIGSSNLAEYNEAASPITVTNKGAITERWAVIFLTSTTFRVVGEQVGEILRGDTGLPTAPLNPATLAPYFTIPAAGWGSGWSGGNVYRFNTTGANAPVWLIRSIAPSDPHAGQDSMTVAIRGNVNA